MAVKSAKHLLLRAMGRAILKEDELHTVIVEVVLNSRPLIVDSGSPNEGEVVTPAHLLVGTTLATLPMAASLSNQTAVLERLVEGLSFEPTAAREMDQRRGQSSDRNSGGNPRRQRSPQLWIMGIVVEVVPGHDGKARLAIVKTKSGLYKRSIHRLAPIPIS
ncbi:uncharacterized protein [Drosophila takahashii]